MTVPSWLQVLAIIYPPLSVAAAILVCVDIFVLGRRQHMAVMEVVWPLTLLYFGPIGLVPYYWFGRNQRHGQVPKWQATFKGAAHCGAGCALGDFIGDWTSFVTGFTVFGSKLAGKYVLAFVLAYVIGIFFQYFAIAPMRGLDLRRGLVAAAKADTASLLAYEIGMFTWMGVSAYLFTDLAPTRWSYWLMMQVAMLLGFATTYPVNWWLVAHGIKESM
jgi:Domain of unknown function (DUF4396)